MLYDMDIMRGRFVLSLHAMKWNKMYFKCLASNGTKFILNRVRIRLNLCVFFNIFSLKTTQFIQNNLFQSLFQKCGVSHFIKPSFVLVRKNIFLTLNGLARFLLIGKHHSLFGVILFLRSSSIYVTH